MLISGIFSSICMAPNLSFSFLLEVLCSTCDFNLFALTLQMLFFFISLPHVIFLLDCPVARVLPQFFFALLAFFLTFPHFFCPIFIAVKFTDLAASLWAICFLFFDYSKIV